MRAMRYQEQLSRVRRYLRRIETHDRPEHDYHDDLLSFFQNCWHLKDWIKNDDQVPPAIRTGVEGAAMGHPELMICADLANGTKHLKLTQAPRAGTGAKPTRRIFDVMIYESLSQPEQPPPFKLRITYFVDRGDGTEVEALELARCCITQWETYLTGQGLSIADP
jgi:hypothetical protein